MATAFLVSGVVHLVRPSVFEPLVPKSLPGPTGLLKRARWAGPASVAVLLAVWPGNFQMAFDVTADAGADDTVKVALVWARLPLQIPMMWAAMQDRD